MVAVSRNLGSFLWMSLQLEHYNFGSILWLPDFWKLPCSGPGLCGTWGWFSELGPRLLAAARFVRPEAKKVLLHRGLVVRLSCDVAGSFVFFVKLSVVSSKCTATRPSLFLGYYEGI